MISAFIRNLRDVLDEEAHVDPMPIHQFLDWLRMICGTMTLFLMVLGWMGLE